MAEAGTRSVPFGFFGTHTDRYAAMSQKILDRELAVMVESGVETLRFIFHWNTMQRSYPPRFTGRMESVTDFLRSDIIVGAAARAGLQIVGNVWGAPPWATGGLRPGETPRFALTSLGGVPENPSDMALFMKDLIERYGPEGTFWRDNADLPARPIRIWQPWQEPDRPAFMPQPFDKDHYVAMAHACYRAVKEADPEAVVYSAGLGPACEEDGFLGSLYERGFRGSFDVLALHPFPPTAQKILEVVRMNRRAMERHGDGALPVVLSQMSFSSALGKSRHPGLPVMKDEEGQAESLRAALTLLAAHREELRLAGIYYHGWSGIDMEAPAPRHPDPWLWTGLRRMTASGEHESKPALHAFREVVLPLEGKPVPARPAGI